MAKVTRQRGAKKKVARRKNLLSGKIVPMAEGLDDEGLKVNLYGPSGSGKTTFWATFPGRILVLISSGGKNPGELKSINTPAYRRKVDKMVINTSTDISEAVALIQEEPGAYSTIVLDHATGLQDLILKEVIGLDETPVQLSWGIASQQDWGQVGVKMKEYFRLLLSLPQNVVIVAQERSFNTDQESSLLMPFVASALSPSVVGWLNPAVDYILRAFKRNKVVKETIKIKGKETIKIKTTNEIEYCLKTAPDEVYTTKFRLPKGKELPDVIVDPTYEKLLGIINQ